LILELTYLALSNLLGVYLAKFEASN